jgi:hypothetical protein
MNNPLVLFVVLLAVIGLLWWFHRSREGDSVSAALTQHQSTAALSSRAQLVEGGHQILVALTLEPQQITYQNRDFDASIDIGQIDEVEYGSDLVTGGIAHGAVLRLRSHGRAIEFVLDSASAEKWSHRLPPHRMNEAGRVLSI